MGQVVVRVVVETVDSTDADCRSGARNGESNPTGIEAGCTAAGLTDVCLIPPSGVDVDDLSLTQRCSDVVERGFPIFTMRGGLFEPKVKVLGSHSIATGQAGAGGGTVAGETASASAPDDAVPPATEDFCRIVSGGKYAIVAGVTNVVTIHVPQTIHAQTDQDLCEQDCLGGGDDDGDGQENCADLVCSTRCAQCSITQDASGVSSPDCTDPGCAEFCLAPRPDGSGGTSSAGAAGAVSSRHSFPPFFGRRLQHPASQRGNGRDQSRVSRVRSAHGAGHAEIP